MRVAQIVKAVASVIGAAAFSVSVAVAETDEALWSRVLAVPFLALVTTPILYLVLSIAPFMFSLFFSSRPKPMREPTHRNRGLPYS